MDLIYKIYSVWLYPNDPLLNLREDHYFLLTKNFTKVYNSFGYSHYLSYSDEIKAIIKGNFSFNTSGSNGIINKRLVKTKDFLTLKVLNDREYDSNYMIYNLYWNETKSGINIFDFNHAISFAPKNGEFNTYSDLRIFEHAHEREIEKRDLLLNNILN